jgi:hypothetical protein
MRDANLESLRNLNENLEEWGATLKDTVHTIQLNKRDLPGVMSADEMSRELNAYGAPVFETIASTGDGVSDALRETVRLIIKGISSRGFSRKTDVARGKPPPPPKTKPKASGSAKGKAVKWEPTPTASAIERAIAEHVDAPPAEAGIDFSTCWSEAATRSEAWAIEQSAGYSGDNRPLFCLLCGISGDQYRRFRALVIKSLRGDPVSQRDALFAVHFATHFAFAA